MRKMFLLFLGVILLTLSACAASVPLSAPMPASDSAPPAAEAAAPAAPAAARTVDEVGFFALSEAEADANFGTQTTGAAPGDPGVPDSPPAPPPSEAAAPTTPERIIHTARAEVETDAFDETLERVYALIDRHGGFLQSANVHGRDFYAAKHDVFSHRQGSFTIRVPAAQYNQLLQDIEGLGAMTFLTTQAENVTGIYTDIHSRLTSLRNQEERILSLFEQAYTMEDIILLEDRLSQVIFEIERLTQDRSHLAGLANYSTIHLTLWEVREMADIEALDADPPTFLDRIGDTFTATLDDMASFARGFVLVLVAVVPWLLVFGVLSLIPLGIILLHIRRQRKRRAINTQTAPATRETTSSNQEDA